MSSVSRRGSLLEFERLYDRPSKQTLQEQESFAKENLPYFAELVSGAEEAYRGLHQNGQTPDTPWKRLPCTRESHSFEACSFSHRFHIPYAIWRVILSKNPTQSQVKTVFCTRGNECKYRDRFCVYLHREGEICQLPVFDSKGHFKGLVWAITKNDPEQNKARYRYALWLESLKRQRRPSPSAEEKESPPLRNSHSSAFTLPSLFPGVAPRGRSYSQVAGSNPRPHSH